MKVCSEDGFGDFDRVHSVPGETSTSSRLEKKLALWEILHKCIIIKDVNLIVLSH